MSIVEPTAVDVATGWLVEACLKATVPLTLGWLASHLPGSASARHDRLVIASMATAVLVVTTPLFRGTHAAVVDATPALLGLWGAGVAFAIVRMGVDAVRLSRVPLRSVGTVHVSPGVASPMTFGWWRPRIVVPPDFHTWAEPDQAAALAHERAHVVRRDWLVQRCVALLRAVLWVHPLAWALQRRLVQLCEHAADERVLEQGHDAASYASLLLRLGGSPPAGALAVRPSALGARIRHVLGRRHAAHRTLTAVTALLTGVGTTLTAPAGSRNEPEVLHCEPAPAPPDDAYPWRRPWSL